VAGLERIFQPVAGMRPKVACEIRPEGVVAARGGKKHGELTMAFAPLPAGVLAPGLKVPNLADRRAVTSALESALGEINTRNEAVTLVVPDAAARVLLLDFDTLPSKRQEALPVVRFRLRKMVPFDVEGSAVSYQVMAERNGQLIALVTVMPGDVLEEYESALRDAGYEPGAVLPSTLAAAAAVDDESATLMVNHTGASVTTAITQGEEMLLHRWMDLPEEPLAREEELAQAVITALAWYEDTLKRLPSTMYYAGLGGASAAAQSRWAALVDPAPRIVDVGVPELASAITSVPSGVTAGVTGALAT
jgi:type IV pilus assembly protein PilM